MINEKDFENKYIVQKKHGVFDYFYLWEKEMWSDLFNGEISITDAINIAKQTSTPFFAMPESKKKRTFRDTFKLNESLGLETIDQKSLFVNAKDTGRTVPFSWCVETPCHVIESKKLLNQLLGFEKSDETSEEKILFDKWYQSLI